MKIMLNVKYASKYRRQSKGNNKALILVLVSLKREALEIETFGNSSVFKGHDCSSPSLC
jgi:hypothetical protein